mgnify:FL=1
MWVGRTATTMAAVWIETIGLLAGIIGIFAWIPQIIQVWVHKRHDGLSLTTFAVVSFALGLWLVYGILVDSFAMIAANIMTLTVIGVVIVGVLKVRKNEQQPEENQL